MQRDHAVTRPYESWESFIAAFAKEPLGSARRGRLVGAVLESFQENGNPQCITILWAILWREMSWVFLKTRKLDWDGDEGEVWHRILMSVASLRTKKWLRAIPALTPARIRNELLHEVRKMYRGNREQWNPGERKRNKQPGSSDECCDDQNESNGEDPMAGRITKHPPEPSVQMDSTPIELQDAQEVVIRKLHALLQAGQIRPEDFTLLVGTQVYGQSIVDYASENGVKKEWAKKRCQRLPRISDLLAEKCPRRVG